MKRAIKACWEKCCQWPANHWPANHWQSHIGRASERWLVGQWASWNAALMFYTCLPIPQGWPLEFRWIARWVPWVGVVVGGLLAFVDRVLAALQLPDAVISALVVAVGIALTGGLHLDGVMDTADGLAVPDASRRLAVMADSHMGAFGGMAAIVLVLLKVLALTALADSRAFSNVFSRVFVFVAVAVWGRWAQQWAIACYPYLKKEGKGAFHKAALPSVVYTLPSLIGMVLLSIGLAGLGWVPVSLVWRSLTGGFIFALLTSTYFARQLGGHTGDTYGAVVEWTEALLLCSLTAGI
jgi:adenosylcobinamide-GDP ribazoletransferase